MSILRLAAAQGGKMLSKVLGSAIANATENEKADADKLVVIGVSVDGGPVTKRWMPPRWVPQPHQQPPRT